MRARYVSVSALLLTLSMLAFAACGDGNGASTPAGRPTATVAPSTPARGPTETVASSTPTTAPGTPSEGGADPVFWRTADGFVSVAAGAEYKIVFRITNGFEEDTLLVVANRVAGGQPIEFRANKVLPVGGDAPGAFYPITITLPQPGRWELVVMAGADEVTIPVDVGEPGPVAG